MTNRAPSESGGVVGKIVGFLVIGFFLFMTVGLPILIGVLAHAAEKRYHFTDVTIDATVQPDGSLSLVERRTVDFHNGPFTYAYFTVDEPAETVHDFSVTQDAPGGEVPLDASAGSFGTPFRATWYYDTAADEQRTFVFRYTVSCAVDRYTDTAQLLWQFVGTGWEASTDHVQVLVHLPGLATASSHESAPCDAPREEMLPALGRGDLQPGETRAWGHGGLNGTVTIVDPQTIRFEVDDVPAATFVEGSILFPSDAVYGTPGIDERAQDRILAYEADLARQANALRQRHDGQRTAVLLMIALMPLVVAALVFVSWRRDKIPGIPKYLEQPPEDDAVEAALVWAAWLGSLSPMNAYRAQVLRLVRIGAVTLRFDGLVTEPTEVYLERGDEPSDVRDAEFVKLLFGDGDEPVKVMHPKVRAKDTSGTPAARYALWWSNAKTRAGDVLTRIEKGDSRVESIGVATATLGSAAAGTWMAAFSLAGPIGYWTIPVGLIALMVGLRKIPARVDRPLRERVQRLAAFGRYLANFSDLPNAPAAGVVIWEQYLEFAAALGVAEQVQKQVKALIPAEQLPSPWPGGPSGAGALSMFNTINSSSAAVIMTSIATISSGGSGSSGYGSFSSSSGFSGGGFSSGGGGGGGGTGGGFG